LGSAVVKKGQGAWWEKCLLLAMESNLQRKAGEFSLSYAGVLRDLFDIGLAKLNRY
jgi:hypothetical protein